MTADLDRFLAIALAAFAAIYVLRCCLGFVLYLASALPGEIGRHAKVLSQRLTPVLARRVTFAIAGAVVAVVGVGVNPASAQPARAQPETVSGGLHAAVPIPGLDRVPQAVGQRVEKVSVESVIVTPGDCLWTLAEDQLKSLRGGKRVAASDIDRQWRRWYQINRDTIGRDPDLIIDGARLAVPPVGRDAR